MLFPALLLLDVYPICPPSLFSPTLRFCLVQALVCHIHFSHPCRHALSHLLPRLAAHIAAYFLGCNPYLSLPKTQLVLLSSMTLLAANLFMATIFCAPQSAVFFRRCASPAARFPSSCHVRPRGQYDANSRLAMLSPPFYRPNTRSHSFRSLGLSPASPLYFSRASLACAGSAWVFLLHASRLVLAHLVKLQSPLAFVAVFLAGFLLRSRG